MAKDKPQSSSGDRHTRRTTQLRLHELLRQQLEVLADQNASNLTTEITIAIRERLERFHLWPPPPAPPPT